MAHRCEAPSATIAGRVGGACRMWREFSRVAQKKAGRGEICVIEHTGECVCSASGLDVLLQL